MATRSVFLSREEARVIEPEDQVSQAVRRNHPHPVQLEGIDDVGPFVNRGQIAPQPEPCLGR